MRLLLVFILIASLFSFVLAEDSGEVETSFLTENYECVADSSSAYWLSADGRSTSWVYNATYDSFGVCNDTVYSNSWCCPEGFECSNGQCSAGQLVGVGLRCSDIKTQDSCIHAPNEFAINWIEGLEPVENYATICSSEAEAYDVGSVFCANYTICGCVWNETVAKCASGISFESACSDDNSTSTSCSWVEDRKEDQCSADVGQITIFYTANGEGDLCVNQEQVYPCSVSVQLPFFDKFNFIFSALAIVGIYSFFRRGNYVK